MNVSYRRGACPGLSMPMATGDGLLARLMPIDNVTLDAFAAFCEAVRAHGNGTIEVSARGSLQVRGLTPASAPLFAAAVVPLDLSADGVPVIADPLVHDPAALVDANALAARLRRAITEAQLLMAPKISIVVDGGGRLHLDALTADIRLRATDTTSGPGLHVALGGDAQTAAALGLIAPENAPARVVDLLRTIAAHGALRAADIVRGQGIEPFRASLGRHLEPAPLLPRRAKAEPLGRHMLRDRSYALGIGLAFGHTQAETLAELTCQAVTHGARWIRPAGDRALLLGDLGRDQPDALADAADRLGFIVDPDDPRRKIAACPGAPACASGHIPARAIAAEVAGLMPKCDMPDIHISGCAKGCAHPMPAALTVVGTAAGRIVIHNGNARAAAQGNIGHGDAAAEIAQLALALDGGRDG